MRRNCITRLLLVSIAALLQLQGVSARCAEPNQPAGIDIGSRKQLFIDERFIATSSEIEPVMNPPLRDGKIPLTTDQPWV